MEEDIKKNDNNEFENLKKQLEEAAAKRDEYLCGWKRERADFINYKKEEIKKIGQLIKYANEELILKILPILDNFYLAEKHVPEGKEFTDGFLQIKKQFENFLAKEGIEPIEVMGKKFDPNLMEAAEEASGATDSANSAESGTVVEEIQRGYTLRGKLIRPARIKVAK
ncbi:MAG: nucleotide exchange factor GrpE [Patescibacteria group bacterium]